MKQPPIAPIAVFYSYAHEDHELADTLRKHLKLMERLELITVWHDYELLPGQEWHREISEQLEGSQVILLLVSAAFISSDYCYETEMTHALERHKSRDAIVVPILLKSCDNWSAMPFGHLQAIPRNGEPIASWTDLDEACTNVVKELRRLITHLLDSRPGVS